MRLIVSLLSFLTFIPFLFSQLDPMHIPKLRNNMLRIYVLASPRPIRKGLFKKIGYIFNKTSDTTKLFLIDTNSKYYSLSEEDRIIIETMLSLIY